MRCFIIREYNVETDIIRTVEETFDRLGIERRDAFSLDINEIVHSNIVKMISEADFVLAILNGTSPNVLFEVGIAVGINKPIFVLVGENSILPFDLKGMTYIHINRNLKENLELPLKYFSASLHKEKEFVYPDKKAIKINIDEEEFFEKLRAIKDSGDGMQFEKFIIDFFRQIEDQYTTFMFDKIDRDTGYDLAIWFDELEESVINPVLFNFKFGKMNKARIKKAVDRVMVSAHNGQTVIILYCDTLNQDAIYENKTPRIMIIKFEDFVHTVFEHGLPKTILLYRNCIAHGRELKYDSL